MLALERPGLLCLLSEQREMDLIQYKLDFTWTLWHFEAADFPEDSHLSPIKKI